MKDIAVSFSNVYKSYPLYANLSGGIKNTLFRLPSTLRGFRQTRHSVLKDLSFNIKRGECVGIIGGNGVGKSTILGLIAQVLKQDSGTIHVSDKVTPLLGLSFAFHPELTGFENITLNGVLIGSSRKKVKRYIDQIVEFSQIDSEYIDQPIRTYSSGMINRLGFSIAAFLDPKILLMDETMATGDIKFRQKCYARLQELRKKNITIISVSHITQDIEMLCDRAIWLTKEGIAMDDYPNKVATEYHKHFQVERKLY